MPAHPSSTARSATGTDTGQDTAVEEVTAAEGAVADVARMATLFIPWALRAAVTLGVFNLVANGVSTFTRMAERLMADTGSLHRLLRHLANLGLLHTTSADRYRLSPTGAVLKSGHSSGLARGLDQSSDAWAAAGDRAVPEILSAVRTGSPAWAKVFGEPFWQSLSKKHLRPPPASEQPSSSCRRPSPEPATTRRPMTSRPGPPTPPRA
ncbi:methyltransferase dimerization domain-containing protein [Streptomyces anulatus]